MGERLIGLFAVVPDKKWDKKKLVPQLTNQAGNKIYKLRQEIDNQVLSMRIDTPLNSSSPSLRALYPLPKGERLYGNFGNLVLWNQFLGR